MVHGEKRFHKIGKKITTSIWIFTALLLGIGIVSAAAVTIHFPQSSSVQNTDISGVDGGNITINASVEIAGGDLNITSVNFSYRPNPSADWILISYDPSLAGNATINLTSNAGNHTYLFPWNLTGLGEGISYELNASAYNDTVLVGSTVVTGITIDSTNPTTEISTIDPIDKKTKTKFFFGGTVTIRCTRSDATAGFNHTNVTIQTPQDLHLRALEITTGTGTAKEDFDITFKETKNLGFYSLICTTTDKGGSVNATANATFEIVSKPPSGGSPFGNPNFKAPVATTSIGKGSVVNIGALTSTGTSRLMAKTATAIVLLEQTEHQITVSEMTTSSATYTINNDFDVQINGGETKTVDLNADGTEDVSIELHQIFSKKADTTFKFVSLKAAPTTGPTTETGPTVEPTIITEKESPFVSILIGLVIVILLIFAVLHFMAKKDSGSKGGQGVSFNRKDLGAYRNQGNGNVGSRNVGNYRQF